MMLSVILPAHNPHPGRLRRTLAGLRGQTLPRVQWEILVVDNASLPPLAVPDLPNARLVTEPQPGLSHARRRGLDAARGDLVVFVDDDNVLAPSYIAEAVTAFASNPRLGALGGRNMPEFEEPPPPWWQPEFDGLLACRDLGDQPLVAADRRDPQTGLRLYPTFAPVGAGMALRMAAARAWLDDADAHRLPDRRGGELSSGGDNDIVLSTLRAGWEVAYCPHLQLTHLIPAARLQRAYLARLNRGIACSWVQVLQRHDACPWPPVPPWTVPLRKLRAYFTYHAWSDPVAFIRWQGACGHFEGLARNTRALRA